MVYYKNKHRQIVYYSIEHKFHKQTEDRKCFCYEANNFRQSILVLCGVPNIWFWFCFLNETPITRSSMFVQMLILLNILYIAFVWSLSPQTKSFTRNETVFNKLIWMILDALTIAMRLFVSGLELNCAKY